MTGGKNGETTLRFEVVEVHDSDSNTTKEFQDLSIEMAGKEIYIGSHYKVKWKQVTSLVCKNDVDERRADEDEDDGDGCRIPKFLQEYRDADYESAGFTLVCSRESKAKKLNVDDFQRFDRTDAPGQDLRIFRVRYPVAPNGHRSVIASWEAFCKILVGGFKKELNKRQKKKDRERARREEELQQQRDDSRRKSSFSRSRSNRTYSRRPYDFMRKNAANIANNAEVWTDDEEDSPGDSPTRETPELVPVDDLPDDAVALDNSAGTGNEDDGSEAEFSDSFEADEANDNIDKINDDRSVNSFIGEGVAEASKHRGLGDDSDFGSKPFNTKSSSAQPSRKKRIKRLAKVLDDSEDEDDNLFMTTPASTVQRVVTPAAGKAIETKHYKHKSRRIVEDYDEDDGGGKDQEKLQKRMDEEEEEVSETNNLKINSFFQIRSKTKSPIKDTNSNENGNITEKVTSEVTTPNPKSITKVKDENDSDSRSKEETSVTKVDDEKKGAPKAIASKPTGSFFAPRPKSSLIHSMEKEPKERLSAKKKRTPTTTKRVLDNDYSDSDETSTVVASWHASDAKQDKMDDGHDTELSSASRAHTPKQKRISFESDLTSRSNANGTKRGIDDEDPIEEVDSSQSESPSTMQSSFAMKHSKLTGSRLPGSIKRRRLKINGSRSALEALEFADTKAQEFSSPILTSGQKEMVTTITPRERSPILPMQLGPQVEKIANDWSNKWRGFRNDGNSCYINSSLQQLFSVPNFMDVISNHKNGNELTATLSDLYTNLLGKSAHEIPINRNKAASAQPVKKVIDRLTNRFHGCQQRDAHEFLGELIDQIHEELSPTFESKENNSSGNPVEKSESTQMVKFLGVKDAEPTDIFFRWNVRVCLECKTCGYSRSKDEMYRYLSIDVGNNNTDPRDPDFVKPAVESCLKDFFTPEDREVNCEKCKDGKIATQTMKILSMPKVILLHLKRFDVVERLIVGTDEKELVFKKNKVPVELTTDLSVGKLLSNNQSNELAENANSLPSNDYHLKSIVHHIGNTANSGHYTTDARRIDPESGKDTWVSFDDGVTVERSLERVVRSTKNQRTAYMLLYSID